MFKQTSQYDHTLNWTMKMNKKQTLTNDYAKINTLDESLSFA